MTSFHSFSPARGMFCFQARAKYLSVAKQMKAYEDIQYAQWHHEVETKLPSLLKRNLLAKPEVNPTTLMIVKVDDDTADKSDNEGGRRNVFFNLI
jgi:hypothetical protein